MAGNRRGDGMGKEKMTQEEYNNLSPEEQNALFATGVLGYEWKELDGVLGTLSRYAWHTEDGPLLSPYRVFDARRLFNPCHKLDDAFMGVDKLLGTVWTRFSLTYVGFGEWQCRIEYKYGGIVGKTRNQAIMLACLKAKGVVE